MKKYFPLFVTTVCAVSFFASTNVFAENSLSLPVDVKMPEAAPTASTPSVIDLPAPGTGAAAAAPANVEPPSPTSGYSTPIESLDFSESQVSVAEDDDPETKYLYMHEKASFHFGADYVYHAFPKYKYQNSLAFASKDLDSTGVMAEFLVFPIKSFGRFGLGPTGMRLMTRHTAFFSGLSPTFGGYGGKAVYEFNYVDGQLFVPYAMFGLDRIHLSYVDDSAKRRYEDNFTSSYYGAGLLINLNRLEPKTASKALVSTGIKKFYLAYGFQYRRGARLERTGGNHLLGLRFEF